MLIYQGGTHRPDWTVSQLQPYVYHRNGEGQLEWLKNYAAYEEAIPSEAIRKTLPLLSKHRVH